MVQIEQVARTTCRLPFIVPWDQILATYLFVRISSFQMDGPEGIRTREQRKVVRLHASLRPHRLCDAAFRVSVRTPFFSPRRLQNSVWQSECSAGTGRFCRIQQGKCRRIRQKSDALGILRNSQSMVPDFDTCNSVTLFPETLYVAARFAQLNIDREPWEFVPVSVS